jgi:carboxypeptidase C (cathepsin A)
MAAFKHAAGDASSSSGPGSPQKRVAQGQHMNRLRLIPALLCALLALPPGAFADPAPDASSAPKPMPPSVPTAVTHHIAHIAAPDMRYTATAGTVLLRDDKDEPNASVFYVAYTAQGLGAKERRPITFSYNGGPGGSSALVHMGAFGPRTVVTTNGAQTPPPPYDIVDNANSLLASSDLVFIDAVGTGFSRLVGKGTGKDFYGIDQDGHAFEQFIRRYITTNDRWNSPKFLAGESYGTTRSAVLVKMLQDDGIAVSGVTLMSNVLDFATLEGGPGDDLPYWLYLPSEAAVAAFHNKLSPKPPDLAAFLTGVRNFAQGPYASALARGASLPPAERDRIAAQLAADTGLPVDYLVRSNLRVPPERFEKTLLGPDEMTLGRYDARFSGFDLDPIADSAEFDPSSDAIFAAFTASFNRYIREELHYRTDAEYRFLSIDINRAWDFKRKGADTFVDVSGDLASALTQNSYLHVFSANGIYDLATPFFATEYTLGHLGINPALQAHITFGFYPSGHMIYLNPVAHAALAHDLEAFYSKAAPHS